MYVFCCLCMIVCKDQNARVAMVVILHMFSLDNLLLTVQVHIHTYVCTYVCTYIRMYVHHLNVCTRTIRCRGQSGYVQTRGTLCIFYPILARCHPIHFDFGSSCPLGEERQLTLKVVNLSGIASSFHAHVVHLPAATSPAPPDKPKPSKGCTHRSV